MGKGSGGRAKTIEGSTKGRSRKQRTTMWNQKGHHDIEDSCKKVF